MSDDKLSARRFIEELETFRSGDELEKYTRYFKTGPGDYGEGDIFIGVRMGQVFALSKKFTDMPLSEIEKLLKSNVHEIRAGGVCIMDWQARRKKTPETRRKELYNLYLRRHDRINNWDLVDRSAPYVVGGYLFDKSREPLYKLAKSEKMWERRTSIVATIYFVRQNDLDDTFKIAEMLLGDKEDLIHKATGWLLRYAGSKDRSRLVGFLDVHASTMPRTSLRYSLEHFNSEDRVHYMNMKNGGVNYFS